MKRFSYYYPFVRASLTCPFCTSSARYGWLLALWAELQPLAVGDRWSSCIVSPILPGQNMLCTGVIEYNP